MTLTHPQNRRHDPRHPVSAQAILIADGGELLCLITDTSDGGFRLRLDRAASLPRALTIVNVAQAMAFEATVAWQKGVDVGLKLGQGANVRGLVPSRLLAARQAWVRAKGR